MENLTDIEILLEIFSSLGLSSQFSEIMDRKGTKASDGKFKHLDLSDLELTDVPNEISSFINLISLNLSHNYLDSLPSFLLNMKDLTSVIINGNAFPDDNWRLYVDNTSGSPTYTSNSIKYKEPKPNKPCSWCGKVAGYTTETGKQSGEWGFSNHYITMLICNSCSHIEQFYGNKSIF